MKTLKNRVGFCIVFFALTQLSAQEKTKSIVLKKDFEIQKHTIMERFEPGYVVSATERAEMKNKRIKNAEYTLGVLDTIEISNRKRKQLLHDLKYNPLSVRLNKFIVDTKFEDSDMADQEEN
ncbi:hypothetical protein [Maribacter sp. 2307UL18-2]|uniref:hypothetical protein n=1 Tax=Maribacter sp. 2307UL18-2 TaxID=3386274 RepID=UPI0039BCA43A